MIARMFRSIVVGTDGSETAGEAVRQARAGGAPSAPRWTSSPPTSPSPPSGCASESRAGAGRSPWTISPREAVEATLAEAADGRRGRRRRRAALYAREGDPADAILDVAEERGADLIVVGNHGMTGAKRFLLGSVPNKVSHHAPCCGADHPDDVAVRS